MTKKTPAAEQFAALNLPEADWTPAMRLAVKQKWSGLPVDVKVADLRAQLAAVAPASLPDVDEVKASMLLAGVSPVSDDDAWTELGRLKRNGAVAAWRTRGQLQAAIDARDLKFAALRAKRGTKVAPPAVVSGDAVPLAS